MSELELKEKELNKLKQESDQLVLNQHPASDKIEVSYTLCDFTCSFRYYVAKVLSESLQMKCCIWT